MTRLYDARGNLYAVTTSHALRLLGIDLPDSAEQAALTRARWATAAIEALCSWPEGLRPESAKEHRSDGLLVGPFQSASPYDLLIVNTDGTLAERSGNGLTIFAQALTDEGQLPAHGAFTFRVHHDQPNSASPVPVPIEAAQIEGVGGFWLDLGAPGFGPSAVGAGAVGELPMNGHTLSSVARLAELSPNWTHSVFVRIGNPHCVTLVPTLEALPSFASLHDPQLHAALVRIAFVGGEPCPAGVNLQWAFVESTRRIIARVFERGEGPTASSGTSASAVACAAWRVGAVSAGLVHVVMPGGTAPVRLIEDDGALKHVMLFGAAQRV